MVEKAGSISSQSRTRSMAPMVQRISAGRTLVPTTTPTLPIAFMEMLGNFIVNDNPSVSSLYDNGINTGNTTYNPVSDWPPYSIYNPLLMDFNTTCPETTEIGGLPYCTGSTQKNEFRLADAYTWEGGRGVRCDFWRNMGKKVPE
ncbi:Uu.00g003660.m01.CDS01 [Anthostomella pinea]|uniref:Uu.00g003660.m01.CDS01 n=1 Tax=Anthostomella pinea TaxID=933095 RepID=A0AAI8VKS2_9PEZI|nr:Uu.00g003660.m01.CDS01 [Anthostomella pinea]